MPAAARRRLPPERRPGRPRHHLPLRPARRRARHSLLPLLRTGRLPLAAPRAERVDRPLRRPLRRGLGRVARAHLRPPARARPAAAGHRAVAPAAVGAGVGRRCRPTSSGSRLASWNASPASCRTPTRRWAGCSSSSSRWASATTRSSWWCRTTARRPRAVRSARSTTCASGTASRPVAASCRPASTRSAVRPPTTTTRGAGPWPATRRSGGGSARCTRAVWPIRASCTGPTASQAGVEIRRQYAHAIDIAPTILDLVGVEPPTHIESVEQSPIEGSELRRASSGDPAAPATRTTQYFEMLGSRAIYHDGWKAVTFKPLAADVRRRPRPRRAVLRRPLGAVPRRRGLLRVPRPGRRPTRPAGRDGRAVVERGPRPPGAAARQPSARRTR